MLAVVICLFQVSINLAGLHVGGSPVFELDLPQPVDVVVEDDPLRLGFGLELAVALVVVQVVTQIGDGRRLPLCSLPACCLSTGIVKLTGSEKLPFRLRMMKAEVEAYHSTPGARKSPRSDHLAAGGEPSS